MKDRPIDVILSKEQFLSDVRQHRMEIIRDDGIYRHLTFRKPGTGNLHFHITTWPGYLCISGDMDTYVFSRLLDMFEFHRMPAGRGPDFHYWAEKVQAENKGTGIHVYDEDTFHRCIRDDFRGWGFPDFATARAIWNNVKEDLIDRGFDSASDAVSAAMGFTAYTGPGTRTYEFTDFWDHTITTHSFGFRWACYAIAWGIKKYDLAKTGNSQEQHDKRILCGAI